MAPARRLPATIIHSAHIDVQTAVMATRAGVQDVMQTPGPEDLLAARSRELANDRRAVRQRPAAAPVAPPPADDQPPLVVTLKDLIAGWPEPIKTEAASLNGATVALPSGQVSAGLAKGKVAFSWGQIRSWLTPRWMPSPSSSTRAASVCGRARSARP